ncbi:hypothetical protein A8C56_11990 [Niabella ginsenosidivorans]|uniref:Quercetin 2,3-dioxygenase C-terminal cupin domain-containing protein n=1 Tax=Niabella ginsenosidivorans TaxID=1176587 RepID=A0A1A9I4H2_9BACT|nr:hypothetical protein [Niabella ginsenosidivorans]ANH81600.1 hypothetical protein A8C56_11990 [Niabella ginsenosidivorans]
MIRQSPAHIFLGANNSVIADETFRTIRICCSQAAQLGKLQEVDEETLAPGISKKTEQPGQLLLLIPVVGDLELLTHKEPKELKCGQMALLNGATISIRNRYKDALVKFLLLPFNIAGTPGVDPVQLFSFDLHKNGDNTVIAAAEITVRIQQLGMRDEKVYTTRLSNAVIFCYIIQGAAEIAGRLLHSGDGLALWNTVQFETESFGSETILLVVETVHYK